MDLILDYEREFPNVVKGVKCDTSACINRTECCGWMKLTAYKQARGKYFVYIDADDYSDNHRYHPKRNKC